jgi:transporter family-2 protein
MERSVYWIMALSGGLLLALMIQYNSLLASYSSPMFASWVAHGLGAVVAIFIARCWIHFFKKSANQFKEDRQQMNTSQRGPFWSYLGGIPGAFTVVLAAITVNSQLGLSSSLALMLVGQVLFGIVTDLFGLFESRKRKLNRNDVFVVLTVLSGSGLVIFF